MWGVGHPDYDPVPTFQQCISRVRQPLRARLETVVAAVGAAAQAFETAAATGQLHTVPQTTTVGTVTKAEMETSTRRGWCRRSRQGARSTTTYLRLPAPVARCACIERSARLTTFFRRPTTRF